MWRKELTGVRKEVCPLLSDIQSSETPALGPQPPCPHLGECKGLKAVGARTSRGPQLLSPDLTSPCKSRPLIPTLRWVSPPGAQPDLKCKEFQTEPLIPRVTCLSAFSAGQPQRRAATLTGGIGSFTKHGEGSGVSKAGPTGQQGARKGLSHDPQPMACQLSNSILRLSRSVPTRVCRVEPHFTDVHTEAGHLEARFISWGQLGELTDRPLQCLWLQKGVPGWLCGEETREAAGPGLWGSAWRGPGGLVQGLPVLAAAPAGGIPITGLSGVVNSVWGAFLSPRPHHSAHRGEDVATSLGSSHSPCTPGASSGHRERSSVSSAPASQARAHQPLGCPEELGLL